jgi:HD-like signal output (HDOD) protein
MKSWLNQLFGASTDAGRAPAGAPVPDDGHALGEAEADIEIGAAYYRWLAAAAGYRAPAAVERQILSELASLAASPGTGASLVPRVPEVITRLLGSLGRDEASVPDLSREVAQDLVLVAEVIREANSAYYAPAAPVKTVEAAIMMLGQNGLRMLLARIAFRPIVKLQSETFAKRVAPQVWSQSAKCALAASLIAPGMNAGVFESYLAGLMHNVGLMVAFRLCDRFCEPGKIPGSGEFGVELLAYSRQLSAVIAAYWEFPSDVCEAIGYAGAADSPVLARVLSKADRMARLSLLLDARVLAQDDPLVLVGFDAFQRRCMGKLARMEG